MSTEPIVPPGKAIIWDHVTMDYNAYLDGEYIGSFSHYLQAEAELNRLALAQLRAGSVWSGRTSRVDDVELPQ